MKAYGFWGKLNTETACVAELMKMYQKQNRNSYRRTGSKAAKKIRENLGLSQILCKHRNAVQIEQNLFKAEVAQAATALFSK